MTTIGKYKDTLKEITKVHLNADAIKIEAHLTETIEVSMLNHTIQLETTLNKPNQEVRIDLFVDLQTKR